MHAHSYTPIALQTLKEEDFNLKFDEPTHAENGLDADSVRQITWTCYSISECITYRTLLE